MDVIEASHLEVIKKFLAVNKDTEFKMRRIHGMWRVGVIDIHNDTDETIAESTSFIKAIEELSRKLMARS